MGVRVKHFGGHVGSKAGDCAVITIDAQAYSEIVIIDTAASIIWQKNELKNYVLSQLEDRDWPITLITTHFHEDHYRQDNIQGLTISRHIYSQRAFEASGLQNTAGKVHLPLQAGENEIRKADTGYLLKCYVPPGGQLDDQNDLSMAVYLEADNFSFLSFGDMTKHAYLRLVNFLRENQLKDLPRAGVTKYPHHGNFALNYINYYEQSLATDVAIISGHSRSEVNKTVDRLLLQNIGAVYCIGRTRDAKNLFKLLKTEDKPVYIADDIIITEQRINLINGQFSTYKEHQMGRRATIKQVWADVDEQSDDSSSGNDSMAED